MPHQEREADLIDDIILDMDQHDQRKTLKRIHASRKSVTVFMKMAATKANLIRSFLKRRRPNNDFVLYFESLEDRAKAISKGFESWDETLTLTTSNYLAKIDLSLTLASKRSNDTYVCCSQTS